MAEFYPYVFLIKAGHKEAKPALENISNFLKDLVFLHDRLILMDPKYNYKYHLSPVFYRRFGRPLPDEDILRIRYLFTGSDILVFVVVGLGLLTSLGGAVFIWLKFLNEIAEFKKKLVGLKKKKVELETAELLKRILEQVAKEHLKPQLEQREDLLQAIVRDATRLAIANKVYIKKVEVKGYRNLLRAPRSKRH